MQTGKEERILRMVEGGGFWASMPGIGFFGRFLQGGTRTTLPIRTYADASDWLQLSKNRGIHQKVSVVFVLLYDILIIDVQNCRSCTPLEVSRISSVPGLDHGPTVVKHPAAASQLSQKARLRVMAW